MQDTTSPKAPRMEKEALLQYVNRWKEVEIIEMEEWRGMDAAARLRKVENLRAFARLMGIPKSNETKEREINEVRLRWQRLKGAL